MMAEHRTDIQILRGIAVLLVVLFHLEIPGFGNGFLGVDVFFVISGYLMARLYDPARIGDYFSRRANRLLPAYFFILAANLVAAFVIATPNEMRQVVEQIRFASLFSANIGYWADNSYFDHSAFKPLLHLWSLGVEIQFYVLLPLIALVCARSRLLLVGLIAGSFAACLVMLSISPKTSFFWLPFRLWQFMLGYAVVTQLRLDFRADGSRWSGLAGLALIGLAFAMPIDGASPNPWRGHPGIAAAIAVAGTCIILAMRLPDRVLNSVPSRILERLGDWSYSLYLVHFPIIVWYNYKPFSGTELGATSLRDLAAVTILTIIATAFLHIFVETPGRHLRRRQPIGFAAVALVVIAATFGAEILQQRSLTHEERGLFEAAADRDVYRCGKTFRILNPRSASCAIASPDNPARRILLVGDSHADSIKFHFASVAAKQRVAVRFMVDNNPLAQYGLTGIVDEAKRTGSDTIVLHFSGGAISAATIGQLTALAGRKGIVVGHIMPVPSWPVHIPQAMYSHRVRGTPLPAQTLAEHRERHAAFYDQVSRIEGLTNADGSELFCKPECAISIGDKPLYFDKGHLTLTGSQVLDPLFRQLLEQLPRPPASEKQQPG